MEEQTTVTVSEQTLARLHKLRDRLNEEEPGPDYTLETLIVRLLDTHEAANDGFNSDPSAEDIAEQLKAEIGTLAFDGGVSDERADKILGRIDDLETEFRTLREALERNG